VIPVRAERLRKSVPIVTWTLVILNVVIYVWDRQGSLFGPNIVFADLSMRPRQVIEALNNADRSFPLFSVFTSLFLHGNLLHLIGNMIFLVVFGAGVEDAIGSVRYTLYYLAWGVAAAFVQIFVMPNSSVPTLGASGAIGGVMGAYFLLFPTGKVELFIPFIFRSLDVSAWILLGVWFLWQILVPQEGVANWAHTGGFLAGMLTVLILGGRRTLLAKPVSDLFPPEGEIL
jgi:membrane associated rhomboid family serine protease